MWRRPDNRRNSGDAYTTRVSNRGIQGFPPDPFSRKYAGRLLKATCAAQPKGCSACFVPQTHYEMQINRDFTLTHFTLSHNYSRPPRIAGIDTKKEASEIQKPLSGDRRSRTDDPLLAKQML